MGEVPCGDELVNPTNGDTVDVRGRFAETRGRQVRELIVADSAFVLPNRKYQSDTALLSTNRTNSSGMRAWRSVV